MIRVIRNVSITFIIKSFFFRKSNWQKMGWYKGMTYKLEYFSYLIRIGTWEQGGATKKHSHQMHAFSPSKLSIFLKEDKGGNIYTSSFHYCLYHPR